MTLSMTHPMPTQIADLHIHSHYSRATSKDLDFEHLALWAQLKGVQIVATGDIAHPGWLQEMRDKLEPAEDGLYRLKPELAQAVGREVPGACRSEVRFLLGGEISNIYKRAAPNRTVGDETRNDVRKVHNLIFAPSLEAVESIQIALEKIGNIRADGRPILGLDSRDLLEIVLEIDARCALIPAHIWTPWFSMLGSKSGFDRVEDCFADLTPHIFALETGLSSDPPMNWRVSNLDRYTLVSNSDAHSPQKLAREATLFHCEPTYDALFAALRTGDPQNFGGTLEFFPEEGKYHNDGHRKCGICWEPVETLAQDLRCSVCGKPVTVGVLHRVETLADRPPGVKPVRTHPYESLVPLVEILAEVYGVGPQSRRVQREYHRLLDLLGPELTILRQMPIETLTQIAGERLATGIAHMRRGNVLVQGGYDGEYGVIKVLAPELHSAKEQAQPPQLALFEIQASTPPARPPSRSASEAPAALELPSPSTAVDLPNGGWTPLPLMADFSASDGAGQDNQARTTARVNGFAPPGAGDLAGDPADPTGPGRDSERAARPSSPNVNPGDDNGFGGWEPLPLFQDSGPLSPGAAALSAISPSVSRSPAPGVASGGASGNSAAILPEEEAPWARLNDQQAAAVQCIHRSLLIVAGPGTGKTHTLTTRIAYLIQGRQVAPEAILAITFTNKAAEEMRARLAQKLGAGRARRLTVQTFHALGASLLREFCATGAPLPGATIPGATIPGRTLAADFKIADAQTQIELATMAAPDLSTRARADLLAAIAHAKNNGLPLSVAAGQTDLAFARRADAYQAQLEAGNWVDYDDLIGLTVELIRHSPAVKAALQARFRWISVDEYQDVNAAQVALLKELTGPQTNLCAIGDPDQAIYGFRGADYRHFFNFAHDFPGALTFTLAQNYRSPQSLLTAATQVIVKNPHRMNLQLHSDQQTPVPVEIYEAPSDRAEAESIVRRIEQMVGGTSHFSLDSGRVDGQTGEQNDTLRSFGDFAVLYRLHSQVPALVEAFHRSGIPFQLVGGPGLLSYADSRWLIEGLRVFHAEGENFAQGRVQHAQGIVQNVVENADGLRLCGWELSPGAIDRLRTGLTQAAGEPLTLESLARLLDSPQRQRQIEGELKVSDLLPRDFDWDDFCTRAQVLAEFCRDLLTEPEASTETVESVPTIHTGLKRLHALCAAHPRLFPAVDEDRWARLVQKSLSYGDRLGAFLESLALEQEQDTFDPRADRVTLMTLHAAKGLEFPVVFMAGCEEGLLPYLTLGELSKDEGTLSEPAHIAQDDTGKSADTGPAKAGTDLEEERRLFYVGLTRARARLILTHAGRRMLFGKLEARRLSRFVEDIEATLKATLAPDAVPAPRNRPQDNQLRLF